MKPIGYIILALMLAVLVYVSREQFTVTVTGNDSQIPPVVTQSGLPPSPQVSQPMPVATAAAPPPSLPPSPPPFPVVSTADSPELVAAKANLDSAQKKYDAAQAAFTNVGSSYKPTDNPDKLNAARIAAGAARDALKDARAEVDRLSSSP
jgi:hypothetical protein